MPNENDESQPTQTIIITGSSGLIGSRLVQLFAGDCHVVGMDVAEPDDALPADTQFMKVDLTSDDSVREAIERLEQQERAIVSVLHLAAYYDFSGEPSDLYEKVTVRGTQRLLTALRDSNLQVEQFVFSSTMLAHKATEPGEPISEDDPLDAGWDYPQSKIDTEQVIEREHGDIPAVLLRVAGVYSDTCDSIPIAQQIRRIFEKKMTSKVYPGDTSRGQAFVHIDDLLDAFRKAVERRDDLPDGVAPILIGEPDTYGYGELQARIAKLVHDEDDWPTQQIPKTVAKTGAWMQGKIPGVDEPFIKPWMIDMADDHYELDIARARKWLDWSPEHRLISTLPKMIDALKQDTEGWYKRHELDLPESVESSSLE